MNSDADLLREEPPGYGGSSKPSPVLIYLRQIGAAHRQGNDTEHTHRPALKRVDMKLNWNKLHIQSRQEICFGACMPEKMADKTWEELDPWLHSLLTYSTELRSKGRIQLCG